MSAKLVIEKLLRSHGYQDLGAFYPSRMDLVQWDVFLLDGIGSRLVVLEVLQGAIMGIGSRWPFGKYTLGELLGFHLWRHSHNKPPYWWKHARPECVEPYMP